MRKQHVGWMFAAILAIASSAHAVPMPLGGGPWITAPAASNSGDTPYSHTSDDGEFLNAGFILEALESPGIKLEYLLGGFGFHDAPAGVVIASITDWMDGELTYASDAFQYDNKHGDIFDSWGGSGMVLFREVWPTFVRYRVAVNDNGNRKNNDSDFNDKIFEMIVQLTCLDCRPEVPPCITDCGPTIPPCTNDCEPPPNVPEPSLMALGIVAGLAWMAKRS